MAKKDPTPEAAPTADIPPLWPTNDEILGIEDIQPIRDLAYMTPQCAPTFHTWTRLGQNGWVLLVLCTTCGITPTEMLASMTFQP